MLKKIGISYPLFYLLAALSYIYFIGVIHLIFIRLLHFNMSVCLHVCRLIGKLEIFFLSIQLIRSEVPFMYEVDRDIIGVISLVLF